MKITCGTDIIEISRIKEDIEKIGESFINRIYTENEIKYCESKKNQKYQHYAVRFAAKEAVFKAISEFLDNKYSISWEDIEILNNSQGKPIVKLEGKQFNSLESIDLSLSHCKEYATANVVIVWR